MLYPELPDPKPRLPVEVARALKEKADAEARDWFFAFRRRMRPTMLWGWWCEEVALELQEFYADFVAGKRPKLALMTPPQHGKSWTALDFIAWVAGKNPDWKTIFASYSDELGTRTNLELQRMLGSPAYRAVFPGTRIGEPGWQCNTSLVEYVNHAGSFRNTTVLGAINGFELHLGVIDDPIKGRREANSPATREMTWSWFVDDFQSRFAGNSALLILMTRWHVDDLLGRYLERSPGEVRILKYPAIATEDERFRKKGEPLFPELKPMSFLEERRRVLSDPSWESLYQQSPYVTGGGLLPVDKLRIVPFFDRKQIKASVRYVDKAATSGGSGAYTAMVLIHAMKDGSFVISDVQRGHWSALEREQCIKRCANQDRSMLGGPFAAYEVGVEQEPGSGGKESAEATIRNLAGFRVYADRVTGSKETRAEPFAAQVQGGNVSLIAGNWVAGFLSEAEAFPLGRYRDQIDAAVGAFTRLVAMSQYNLAALAS
jgi:predicted phage terminase large subunit-like protein